MRLTVLAALLAACGGHDHPGTTTFASIDVEPAQATVTVPLGGSAMQAYTIDGIAADGTRTDITADCLLAIDSSFGTTVDQTVTVGAHGGKTTVGATCGDKTGSAQLIVDLAGTVVVAPAPSNSPDLFGTAMLGTDPSRTPVIQYPLDHAVSPRNMPSIEHQWAASGNDLFHVALTTTFATVDVYTTDVKAILDESAWDALIGTAAGDSLAITVEGLVQATPATKYAASVAIKVSQDTIDKSAIYYWASSQGNIMQQTFGVTTAPGLVKGGCTSCHSVSRTASRIGYSRCVANDCGQLYAGFMKYDANAMTWNEVINADGKTIHGSYSTFAPLGNPFPTDDQSVAIESMVDGTLQLYDPDTGTVVPSNIAVSSHGIGGATGGSALMADWSADGTHVVFTSTPHQGQWIDLSDGSIAIMTYQYQNGQHVFGEPQFPIPNPITLPSGTYSNFFFPSFSPDNALIVFDAARGSWRDGNGAKAVGSRLMLADAGGAWYTDMPAMNGGDNDITWAHWAPSNNGDYYWVVFSSERDYGHEVTAANTNPQCFNVGVTQCKQIWIGAIAKSQLSGTGDPSAPPMWLPGQDTQADNISPYWSVPAGLQ